MEAVAKAKQIGGSIGAIIPKDIVKHERICVDDIIMSEIFLQSMTEGVSHQFLNSGRSLSMLKNHLDVLN